MESNVFVVLKTVVREIGAVMMTREDTWLIDDDVPRTVLLGSARPAFHLSQR